VLQVIFGDDEHTAADGPYNRLLKARKWLYAFSLFATLQYYGLVNYSAVENITKSVISLDVWLINVAMLSALGLLSAQYLMLLVQTASAYSDILNTRLRSSFEAKANKLQEEVDALRIRFDASEIALQNNPSSNSRINASQRNEHATLERRLENSQIQFEGFINSRPEQNPVFVNSEVAIDFLRTTPPMIFSIIALVHILVRL
jgi:hypothetical protein